jgi:PAS domain S-box-containing protein
MRLGPGGRLLLFGVVAAAAVGSLAIVLWGAQAPPEQASWLSFAVGVSFAVSGLLAWWRRPYNRTGPLMVAFAVTWFARTQTASDDSTLFTLGLVLEWLPLAIFAHLVLAFPSGRLESRAARWVVVAAYVDVLLLQLVVTMLNQPSEHGCAECPPNALAFAASDGALDAATAVVRAISLGVVAGGLTVLLRRWRAASPAYRRVLAPVLATGTVVGIALAANLLAAELWPSAAEQTWWIVLVALGSVPVAFLVGMVRARLAQTAVTRLVVELGATPPPGELREALARALGDPSLLLAYWLPESSAYVDLHGRPFALPEDGDGQVATVVDVDGRHVGALVHDAALADHPELVRAVCAAAGLALENERLHVELRSRLDELAAERDFVTAVIDTADALVLVLDAESRIVRFNRACERLSGFTADEMRGRPLADLLPPGERDGVAEALAAVGAGRHPSENENHWLTRSGELRLIAWMNTALVAPTGEIEFVVSSGLDITEKRRAEDELRASRARIVEVGDNERRRLERNLHDGAQQHLVALLLTLRLARSKTATDPEGADRLIASAMDELEQGLAELRELARGIHPAVLTERGLAGAVEALAQRTPTRIEVEDALEGTRVPPPVEVAAYYVVAESLANASKHAGAETVRVSLARRNGTLLVEIADDGVGGASAGGGSGLVGLADRVQALDGSLEVESRPGRGTTVRAALPIAGV